MGTRATVVEQLHDAVQHTAMSTLQEDVVQHQRVTPPSSLIDRQPLTPPLTDKKPFAEAIRVVAFFREILEGRNTTRDRLVEFKLAEGDYAHIERTLRQDDELWGFAQNKIRFVDIKHGENYS